MILSLISKNFFPTNGLVKKLDSLLVSDEVFTHDFTHDLGLARR